MTVDRQSPRRLTDRILSIEIAPGNHAIVLNISDEGLGFHAINPLTLSGTVHFSFADGGQRIEASGELVWIDSDKKNGGLRFDSLPQPTRERIQRWAAPVAAAAAEPAIKEVAPTPPFQTNALPNPGTAPTEVGLPPSPYVPAASTPPNRGVTPAEANSQSPGYFWYQAPEYPEYQAGQAESGSRGRFFRGFVSGAIVAVILAVGLFVVDNNQVTRLLAEAKTTIFGVPASRPQQGSAAPAPLAPIPQAAIPPPLVSSGLPPVAGPPEPASSAPLPGSAADLNTGDVAPQTQPKSSVASNGVENRGAKSAHESLPSQPAQSDDSGDEDLDLAQKYLAAKTGPAAKAAGIQLLWAAVGKGNATAELTLADLYARGDGVKKSCDQARVLASAAEGKNSSDASREFADLIRRCR